MRTHTQTRTVTTSRALRKVAVAARFIAGLAVVIVLAACKHH